MNEPNEEWGTREYSRSIDMFVGCTTFACGAALFIIALILETT